MAERRGLLGIGCEIREWRQERVQGGIRLFVGGRVTPGHDGKVLNSKQ
jgi:hypothetical protein